mmetsp:Transcript_1108/g.2655  ORF Transcript_1108/g.2655 Transcript_1108/m.2655 type:complete len:288 (-) Transcript_1108:3573-4436(-)
MVLGRSDSHFLVDLESATIQTGRPSSPARAPLPSSLPSSESASTFWQRRSLSSTLVPRLTCSTTSALAGRPSQQGDSTVGSALAHSMNACLVDSSGRVKEGSSCPSPACRTSENERSNAAGTNSSSRKDCSRRRSNGLSTRPPYTVWHSSERSASHGIFSGGTWSRPCAQRDIHVSIVSSAHRWSASPNSKPLVQPRGVYRSRSCMTACSQASKKYRRQRSAGLPSMRSCGMDARVCSRFARTPGGGSNVRMCDWRSRLEGSLGWISDDRKRRNEGTRLRLCNFFSS